MHFLRVWLRKCDFEDGNHLCYQGVQLFICGFQKISSNRKNYFDCAGQNVRQAFNALPDILSRCQTFFLIPIRESESILGLLLLSRSLKSIKRLFPTLFDGILMHGIFLSNKYRWQDKGSTINHLIIWEGGRGAKRKKKKFRLSKHFFFRRPLGRFFCCFFCNPPNDFFSVLHPPDY